MSIMFNEICINEEMLPKYTYIYFSLESMPETRVSIYIYIYIYIVLFGPVKPELGGILSGQKTIQQ